MKWKKFDRVIIRTVHHPCRFNGTVSFVDEHNFMVTTELPIRGAMTFHAHEITYCVLQPVSEQITAEQRIQDKVRQGKPNPFRKLVDSFSTGTRREEPAEEQYENFTEKMLASMTPEERKQFE